MNTVRRSRTLTTLTNSTFRFLCPVTSDSEYLDGIITAFVHEHGACRPFLAECTAECDGSTVTIGNITGGKDLLERHNAADFLRNMLRNELQRDFEVRLDFSELNVERLTKRWKLKRDNRKENCRTSSRFLRLRPKRPRVRSMANPFRTNPFRFHRSACCLMAHHPIIR